MKGIVTSAGGQKYFLNAYLNLKLLREIGCKLPFAWFYMGDEMKPEWIEKAKEIGNITFHDLGNNQADNSKDKGGWQSKIKSIIQAPFDEVLFIDADSFPKKDPEYLFEHPIYKKYGAVIWQDIWTWSKESLDVLNKKYDIEMKDNRQAESGQLLFNKNKVMPALWEVNRLNEIPDTYDVVYGDKDTFLLGFNIAGMPYHLNQHKCDFMQGGLLQPDLDGKPLFQHLTGGKWAPHGRPFARIDNLQKAMEIVNDIKEIL